jgi:hypothetical protein
MLDENTYNIVFARVPAGMGKRRDDLFGSNGFGNGAVSGEEKNPAAWSGTILQFRASSTANLYDIPFGRADQPGATTGETSSA